MASPESFTDRVKGLIKSIPAGRVCTYGTIAALAGNHRASRQVARILHACSEKEQLPWHRVINKQGEIALRKNDGVERQKTLLEMEGVKVSASNRVDLGEYLWQPET